MDHWLTFSLGPLACPGETEKSLSYLDSVLQPGGGLRHHRGLRGVRQTGQHARLAVAGQQTTRSRPPTSSAGTP